MTVCMYRDIHTLQPYIMNSSRIQDRVNSNDKSKGTRKIISGGRKQFKVGNKCGTKRVNFRNPYGCRCVKYSCCTFVTIKNISYKVFNVMFTFIFHGCQHTL